MTEQSPGTRAVSAYEIDDVFLVAANCSVEAGFNPTQQFMETVYGHRIGIGDQIQLQKRVPQDPAEKPIFLVRYLISGEIKLLKPEVKLPSEATEPADTDVIATIQLTFAADYRCSEADHADQEALSAFGRNAMFHIWPYWREAVHEIGSRMRLPRITLPMWKPKTG